MIPGFGVRIFVGNLTNSTENEHGNSISFEEQVADVILMTSCIVVTVIGNVLVILSVFTHRPLRNVQNFYIVSLACADLAVALVVMPFSLVNICLDGRWVFGAVFCNVWLTSDILTCTASILNLCGIAVDRYFAIHDPIAYSQRRTVGRVLVNLVVIWLVSAVISVPPLIGWNNRAGESLYDEEKQVCKLTDDRGFVVYSASGSFYIPLCLMSFVYVKIFVATRTRLRARACAAATFSLAAQSVAAGSRCSGGLINWSRSVTLGMGMGMGRDASRRSWEYEDTEACSNWNDRSKMELERNGHCRSFPEVGGCELAMNELRLKDSNVRICEPRTTHNEAHPKIDQREPETGLGGGSGNDLRIDEIPEIQDQENIRISEEEEEEGGEELRNNVTEIITEGAEETSPAEKTNISRETVSSRARRQSPRLSETSLSFVRPRSAEGSSCKGWTALTGSGNDRNPGYPNQVLNTTPAIPLEEKPKTSPVKSFFPHHTTAIPLEEKTRTSPVKALFPHHTTAIPLEEKTRTSPAKSLFPHHTTAIPLEEKTRTSPVKALFLHHPTAIPLEEKTRTSPANSLLPHHPTASKIPFFTTTPHNHPHPHQQQQQRFRRYPPKTISKSAFFRMRSSSARSSSSSSSAAVQFSTGLWSERRQRASQAKERRVARTMAVVMAAFVACWLPFFLVYVIFAFCERCANGADRRLVDAVVWFGYANSTLNPVIYTVFNVDFRRAFVALLGGGGRRRRRRCANGQTTKRR